MGKVKNSVWIEDLGLVSALGEGKAETLANMRRGAAPGMRKLTGLVNGDETYFGFAPGWGPTRPSELKDGEFRVGALVDRAYAQLAATVTAMKAELGAERIGVVMGSSNSTMEEFTDHPDRINMNYPAERLAEIAGVKGPVMTVSTACSSSGKVFASARRLLAGGVVDAVLVGGADAYTRTVVEGFHSLEALSSRLCRPGAPDRDGISLGEGCAVMVMRNGELGEVRGKVRLLGVGESSDAYHLTAPDPDGKGAETAMRAALADAGMSARELSFVNLHGTGTVYNDGMELKALRRVCEVSETASLPLCAVSTKPLTGHCLGAAGAIEAGLGCLALLDRFPTPYPRAFLSNSFAFGGSNVAVIFGLNMI